MASTGTKRVRLATLLAAGHSYDSCAKELNISKRTIVRLNSDAAFSSEIQRARALLLEQTVGILSNEATATVRTLIELRDGGTETTRLGACRTILEKLTSAREHVELEARLAAIEQAVRTSRQTALAVPTFRQTVGEMDSDFSNAASNT